MSSKPRDTYRYHYKIGNKVVHTGITTDPQRREAEHQRAKPGGRLVAKGPKVTRASALRWDREQLQDIASRGHAIYQEQIRHLVYPQEKGSLVAVDIHTGDYEVDSDELAVIDRLQRRHPDAAVWVERVGYQAVNTIGGALLPDDH